jgi:phenylacetate-CoA ligase
MMDNGATALCCTPTYAIRLGEVAVDAMIDLRAASVKTIIVAGEPGGSIPATRARLAQLWPGVRIFDHHGMTETGPVSFECPARPGALHVLESAFFAEIVDPATGQPVAPGRTGELILTPLGRTGAPLLRYRTGDLVKCEVQNAKRQARCACGRSDLALEGGILGRADDMVIVRGVNIYPAAVEEIIRLCGGVAEYRVHVANARALAEMRVEIEPLASCLDVPALVKRLEKAFETAFVLRVPVSAVPPGALPRFEMKAKRWIRD